MALHIAAQPARMIFQLTFSGFERIPNGEIDVLMGLV
jgi:hypothetical protein